MFNLISIRNLWLHVDFPFLVVVHGSFEFEEMVQILDSRRRRERNSLDGVHFSAVKHGMVSEFADQNQRVRLVQVQSF